MPGTYPTSDDVLDLAAQMFDLAREGSPRLLGYLDAGVPVNLTNAKGDTLLILAAYYGHAATVSALLERGADTARRNDRGQTALAGAVFKRSAEVVTVLVDAGADPDLGSPSARQTADFFGYPELAALLAGGG